MRFECTLHKIHKKMRTADGRWILEVDPILPGLKELQIDDKAGSLPSQGSIYLLIMGNEGSEVYNIEQRHLRGSVLFTAELSFQNKEKIKTDAAVLTCGKLWKLRDNIPDVWSELLAETLKLFPDPGSEARFLDQYWKDLLKSKPVVPIERKRGIPFRLLEAYFIEEKKRYPFMNLWKMEKLWNWVVKKAPDRIISDDIIFLKNGEIYVVPERLEMCYLDYLAENAPSGIVSFTL